MKRTLFAPVDCSAWSREQLIKYIQTLEGGVEGKRGKGKGKGNGNGNGKGKGKGKGEGEDPLAAGTSRRCFDYSAYPTRHIALKVAYFGWKYNGFASQLSYKPEGGASSEAGVQGRQCCSHIKSPVVAVEDLLFEALLRTKLIESPRLCNYSRCGRTDAGVSSTGQVIALTVRASQKKTSDQPEEWGKDHFDMPICSILNRTLPPDIRILGWSLAQPGFNARFDCRGRKYKYFFPGLGLDISKMQDAASKLVGTHDFRNFCRKDTSNTVKQYVRQIFTSLIQPMKEQGIYEYEVHGSAFLYHQVRCMMEIMFLVGRGVEPPEVVDYMLDVSRCTTLPRYELASEIPLVLYECYYANEAALNFRRETSENENITAGLFDTWRQNIAKSMTVNLLLKNLALSPTVPFLGRPAHPKIYNKDQHLE